MAKYTTPNGKDISTYIVPNTVMYAIKLNQGGALPERLWGNFTSERFADQAIEQYLAAFKANKDKVEVNKKEA
jgi:hypothetical protein